MQLFMGQHDLLAVAHCTMKLMSLVLCLMLLMMHLSHLLEPWRLDRFIKSTGCGRQCAEPAAMLAPGRPGLRKAQYAAQQHNERCAAFAFLGKVTVL